MKVDVRELKVHKDDRGWLAEILRQEHTDGRFNGQFYVTTAKPGISKADHYHKRKTEWFCVISGEGLLILKDLKTGETKKIEMGEKNMVVVKISPNVAHKIKNVGEKEMFLLAYIDEVFDEKDPDTISYEVEG